MIHFDSIKLGLAETNVGYCFNSWRRFLLTWRGWIMAGLKLLMFMIRCCLTRLLIFPPSQPGDEGTLLASVILCVTLWNSSLSPLTHRLKCSSFVPVRSLMSYLTTMIKSWEYCSVSPRCVLMSAAGDKLIYSDVSRRSAAHLTLALHCSVLQHSLQCTSCGLILQARKIARHTFLCCETWGFCKQSLNATIKLNLVL